MSFEHDEALRQLIALAKSEDFGAGDITTSLIPNRNERARFRMVAKRPGVFAGREVLPLVARTYDPAVQIEWRDSASDGAVIEHTPCVLATLTGPLGSILSAERVMLNFVQRLCGIATQTRRYVDAVAGTGAEILDTRKTTPGWRTLEKYAVRCAGGRNHRQGLFDAVLVKDNHVFGGQRERLAGTVFEMLNRLSSSDVKPDFVEVEAASLREAEELFKVVGVDVILLDNFAIDDLHRTVQLRDRQGLAGKVRLEASGRITLDNVREVAMTGVERISVGALTHSAAALDISMERE